MKRKNKIPIMIFFTRAFSVSPWFLLKANYVKMIRIPFGFLKGIKAEFDYFYKTKLRPHLYKYMQIRFSAILNTR